jgi:hypothetical protein
MKNHKAIFVLQYILVLGLSRNAFAQRGNYNYKTARRSKSDCLTGVVLSAGVNHIFSDKTNFDVWANNTNHKTILQSPIGYNMDMTFVEKQYDFGYHLQGNYPYGLITFFVGTNLCRRPHFRSFLNAEIGGFQAQAKHLTPPNYTLTPTQQGKTMFLEYSTGCVGLSLKNMYISKPNNNNSSFVSTIDVQFGYMPWHGTWDYGYQSGKHFYGTPVSGIPQLSNMCFSITYSIGILAGPKYHNR